MQVCEYTVCVWFLVILENGDSRCLMGHPSIKLTRHQRTKYITPVGLYLSSPLTKPFVADKVTLDIFQQAETRTNAGAISLIIPKTSMMDGTD